MPKPNHQKVKDFFNDVLGVPASDRDSWFRRNCPDPSIRQEVESLLHYHDGSGSLDQPAFVPPADQKPPFPQIIDEKYRLLRKLGEGGMGVVFLAERCDGHYSQQVALKILTREYGGARALRRFQMERQILAALSHPNISKLLDGGVGADGRHYLVMEYVDGVRLDLHCDQSQMSIPQRLELFAALCETLDYAHGKDVVHRDLKPGNIMVDRDGRVKLLDFGIAKVKNPRQIGWEKTLNLTPHGEQHLTLKYASPEQFQGAVLTSQSDIYSLGVVLYELLCGRNPHRLQGLAPDQFDRVFLTDEPEPLHVALMQSPTEKSPSAQNIALQRGTTVASLIDTLSGELAGIVFRALKKKPSDRYATALEFAERIHSYLEHRTDSLAKPYVVPGGFDRIVEIRLSPFSGVQSAEAVSAPSAFEAVVSPHAPGLCLSLEVAEQLGISVLDYWQIEVEPGRFETVGVAEPVRLQIQNRSLVETAFVFGTGVRFSSSVLRKFGIDY